MAKSNRDLTIALISKADQFDLTKPAEDLEKLGEAGKDAGRDVKQGLDDIGDAGRDVGRDLGRGLEQGEKGIKSLGDEADKTRRDLNQFFDKLGAEAKKAGRDTKDGLKSAERGFEDFKDEASQSGREAAASFSGSFEDVGDFIQETLANGFAGMGKVGMGVGLAAAAGLGVFMTKLNEARERVKQLANDLLEIRLNPEIDTEREKIEAFLQSLKDAGDLNRFQDAARKAGVDWREWVRAMALGGPELDRMADRLKGLNDGGGGFQRTMTDLGRATNDLRQRTLEQQLALEQTTEGFTGYTTGMSAARDTAAEMVEKIKAANQAMAETAEADHAANMDAIATSISGVASAADEFATQVAEDGQVALNTLTEAMNAQTEAALNHQKNLQKALTEGGEAFAAYMAQQPAEVAQAYVNGSDKERAAFRDAAAKNMGAVAQGTLDGAPVVATAANTIYNTAKSKLTGQPIMIPVGIDGPSVGQVDAVLRQIRARFGTVTIPVGVDAPRWGGSRFLP